MYCGLVYIAHVFLKFIPQIFLIFLITMSWISWVPVCILAKFVEIEEYIELYTYLEHS